MADMDKVIRALHCCAHTDGSDCIYCPYDHNDEDCTALMSMDVLELLKEQKAKTEKLIGFINGFSKDAVPVVRCKDCKHQNWVNAETGCIVCKIGRGTNAPDWFCADGESKEGR